MAHIFESVSRYAIIIAKHTWKKDGMPVCYSLQSIEVTEQNESSSYIPFVVFNVQKFMHCKFTHFQFTLKF
jgi:hypothetical protein